MCFIGMRGARGLAAPLARSNREPCTYLSYLGIPKLMARITRWLESNVSLSHVLSRASQSKRNSTHVCATCHMLCPSAAPACRVRACRGPATVQRERPLALDRPSADTRVDDAKHAANTTKTRFFIILSLLAPTRAMTRRLDFAPSCCKARKRTIRLLCGSRGDKSTRPRSFH